MPSILKNSIQQIAPQYRSVSQKIIYNMDYSFNINLYKNPNPNLNTPMPKYTAKHPHPNPHSHSHPHSNPQPHNNSYSHHPTNRNPYQYQPQHSYEQYAYQNSLSMNPRGAAFQCTGSPVGLTQYLSLTNEDLIYYGNLHRLTSPDFQFVLRKITKDLNLLLQFNEEDFWTELTTCQSLQKSIRSCLQILPRKHFGEYISSSSPPNPETPPLAQILHHQTFKILSHLMRITLFLYHRLICTSTTQHKDIVYDEWLLDVPKMFNLIGIYRHVNEGIVREIIGTAFREIPEYRDDIGDFVRIMATTLLDSLTLDFKFQYTQKIIKNSVNFNNPMLSFTRNLIKSFFRAFEIYITLIDFVNFFPVPYVMKLVGQPDLVLELIDRYFQYLDNINGRWEFLPEFLAKFQPNIELVRQTMIEFFLRCFDFFDYILSKRLYEQSWNNCLKAYFSICYEFHRRNQSPCGSKWQTLINILILETPQRNIFKLEPFFAQKLDEKEMEILKECQQYEQQYRKQQNRKNFGNEQILQLKLNSIKSYKEWKDFQNFTQFDLMVQNSYRDSTIRQDSILNLLQTQLRRTQSQKKPHDPNLYQLSRKKVRKGYPFFPHEEYNDEPLDIEAGEEQYVYMGMEPQEDQEDCLQQNNNSKTPDTEIGIKNPTKFLKTKHQYQSYQKYYNSTNNNNSNNNNSDIHTKPGQKIKKTYIALDQLSIQYVKNSQAVSTIKVEKLEHRPASSVFKTKQPNNCQQLLQQSQQQQYEINNLTIGIKNDNQEDNELIFQTKQLQNLMQDIERQELSIIKQSKMQSIKHFDLSEDNISELELSQLNVSGDNSQIHNFIKKKSNKSIDVSKNGNNSPIKNGRRDFEQSNYSINCIEKRSDIASNVSKNSINSNKNGNNSNNSNSNSRASNEQSKKSNGGNKKKNPKNKKQQKKKLIYNEKW